MVGYPLPTPPPPASGGAPRGTPDASGAGGAGSEAGAAEATPPRGTPDFRLDRPPSDAGAVDLASIPDVEPRQEAKNDYGNMGCGPRGIDRGAGRRVSSETRRHERLGRHGCETSLWP